MNRRYKRSCMVGKTSFVVIFSAAMLLCGSRVPAIPEREIIYKESLSMIPKATIVPSVTRYEDSVTQELEIQSEKIEQHVEELAVIEQIEPEILPVRENNLYYIIDDGYRFDISEDWQDYLYNKCVEHGITEYYELLFAQIYHESGWNPEAVSQSADYGLMQINECNHEWLKEELDITNFLDPYDSIDAGTYMMSTFLEKYNDVQKALVCYNMGESKVKEGITTSEYSRCVVNDMEKLFILKEEETE